MRNEYSPKKQGFAIMKELEVTYHAPKGDAKVVEMLGQTFYDGKSEKVIVDDRTLAKLQGNRHFQCGEPKDHKPDYAKEQAAKGDDDDDKKPRFERSDHKGR
jgi:hypothetical protein